MVNTALSSQTQNSVPSSSEMLIDVRGFKKSFGNKVVHTDINFSVKRNECFGLLGGSGTGKSVLLRSLIGLERPDEGEVNVLGMQVAARTESELLILRQKVSYVFQNGALFDSQTVYENLAFPMREHRKFTEQQISDKITNTLAMVGLSDVEALYPHNLSGGMQKRVGLARSLILEPEVLLYDEPTAGLDPFNTRKIQELISSLQKAGRTSILVTHDMPVAFSICDRIALLQDGKLVTIIEPKKSTEKEMQMIRQFSEGQQIKL